MQIKPSTNILKKWISHIPADGDLIFLDSKSSDDFQNLLIPRYTVEEVRAQSQTLWTLQMRSWYGYVLNQATTVIWMAPGELEKLEQKTVMKLAQVQIRLKVPTLISSSHLSTSLKSKIKKYGRHHWLSSGTWRSLSKADRLESLESWGRQNKVFNHKGPCFEDLPQTAQTLLNKSGFKKLLNSYSSTSGPNCLAFAAAIATGGTNAQGIANQWMHGPPFLRHLKFIGYKKISNTPPQAGDVLIFYRGSEIVHAGFYLGEGLYYEKSGQDFYEPYQVKKFQYWKKYWPDTTLSIWRSSLY